MYVSIIALSRSLSGCFLQRDTKKLLFKTMAHLPPPFREAFRNKVSMEEAQPSLGLEMLGLDFRVP